MCGRDQDLVHLARCFDWPVSLKSISAVAEWPGDGSDRGLGARLMFRTRVGRKLRLIQQGDWHSLLKRVATRWSVGFKLQETVDNEGTVAGKRQSLMASLETALDLDFRPEGKWTS